MGGPVLPAVLLLIAAGATAAAAPPNPFQATTPVRPRNAVDEIVFRQLDRLGLRRAPSCSDAVFLRRAYLDVIGTLPTEAEARAFLADPDPGKRDALVERLFTREEFADYWAMKWGDLLRVKSEFPINLWPNAVQAYHRWIRTAVRDDMPYDRFARALLTESGSNFRVPPVNFYRAVQGREPSAIASAVALTFMATRAERWPKERLAGMAVFFSRIGYKPTGEWKEEIVYFDPRKGSAEAPRAAVFPDGHAVELRAGQDPREVFADWLTSPRNPWFARAVVNRVWGWLMGRGIVHEPDDMRPDNPPSNEELLAYLERELVASHYDLRRVFRLILHSATYQLSSAASDERAEAQFAQYALRPLDAEVLIDALCQLTGGGESYSSAIPEPYTFTPEGQRAVALADGSITSSFLETFGRPSRDTGLDAERQSRPTAAERLQLLNSSHVQRKLQQSPTLRALIREGGGPRQVVTRLYLTLLSRYPTEAELLTIGDYAAKAGGDRRTAALDLAWALVNTPEFQYRH